MTRDHTPHPGVVGKLCGFVPPQVSRDPALGPAAIDRQKCEVDPRCGELDYLVDGGRALDCEYVMNNNFAFGGINTSLIFKRWKS